MSSRRSTNKENERRLSSFGERLQSLSDTFYSTILEESIEKKKPVITNAAQLEQLRSSRYSDFTFDESSTSRITSKDNFSFTFHSIDQPQRPQTRINRSSTPCSIRQEKTVLVEETRPPQPVIVGYYPVITYQPICLPPICLPAQENDFSRLTEVTPMKKTNK